METNELNTRDYRLLIEEEYLARKSRNPLYSVRTFARHLGISKTALSDVLARKRHFSRKNAEKVVTKLGLPLETMQNGKSPAPSHAEFYVADDTFRMISEWYHFAILSLVKIPTHQSDPTWVANRLAISVGEARNAVLRLVRLGFLTENGGKFRRAVGSLDTRSDIPSAAVRQYHRQNLRLADEALDRTPVDEREFGTVTVAIDPAKLKKAKKEIRSFRAKMSTELESKRPERVYTLAIQFFPVSDKGEGQL